MTRAMATVVIGAHLLGFGMLWGLDSLGPITVGAGILAYTLGLRHAFDADHIAAIDSSARELAGRDPTGQASAGSVGFWFALGHCTVVFVLALLLAVGVRALVGPISDGSSTLHTVTDVIGPSVSGVFLWIIGLVNLVALAGLVQIFTKMRSGTFESAELERHLESRGLIHRLIGQRVMDTPGAMYSVGLLFGLGFDTATEISLLILAGGAAALELPLYAILVLPILFSAGMLLMDSLHGAFVAGAYRWAFTLPVRKVYYNLTVTSLSVVVALGVGTIQLAGAAAAVLPTETPVVAAVAGLGLDTAGYLIAGSLAGVWLIAMTVWRVGRIEQRWSTT